MMTRISTIVSYNRAVYLPRVPTGSTAMPVGRARYRHKKEKKSSLQPIMISTAVLFVNRFRLFYRHSKRDEISYSAAVTVLILSTSD